MSFLKKLFGVGGGGEGGATDAPASAGGRTIEHKGFTIRATPFKENGQFQTCGVITKEIDGERKEHRFIRADRFPGQSEAEDTALSKGRQIVDEQGERLFG